MAARAKIRAADIAALEIIHYPDPKLRQKSVPVAKVDQAIRLLVDKMFELMFAAHGVGLAATQVGLTIRLFVASPAFEPSDRRVYVNPEIVSTEDAQEADEGCLSFPGITCKIKRPSRVTIRATDLDGNVFEETAEGLAARVLLHEIDHLDGRLLIDRMSIVAKLANRVALKDLEDQFSG
jgi:peptide deformylase